MERSVPKWIALVLLGAAAIVVVAVVKHGDPANRHQPGRPVVELSPEQIEPARQSVQTVESPRDCPGQLLEVALNGTVELACMSALITKHNGSVRSHQASTLTGPQRWLRVEVAGGTILSAAWGSDLRPDFQCQAAECQAITISRRDAQGARVMTLEHTPLMRAQPGATPPVQESLQLSGHLEIPAEPLAELACDDQGVSIVTSDSSSQTFCPQGGAGFEIGDDGARRYRFTNLDGESILVATDRDQQIRQVQYEGEVMLACRSIECGSVRISAADAEGARRFTFSGATLIETQSGQSSAVLNGSLILPPL